jgi:tetratricopeptide (TPR) repeat protein
LVSDDFKIHTTQMDLGLSFKVVSPSAFLLKLSNSNAAGHDRRLFRRLYRHVRRREIEYMLSRRDTYNIEPKLGWLVDNLLASETGAGRTRIVKVTEDHEVDFAPVYRYISGEHVRSSKLADFKDILSHLEFLKEYTGTKNEVMIHVEAGEFESAIQLIRTAIARLKLRLQLASTETDVVNGLKLRQVYAHFLTHYYFMIAFLTLSTGDVLNAEERLDDAGFCALITRDVEDILKASYIKSLLYLSVEDHREAREQFEATERLAIGYGSPTSRFRALFGKGLTIFLAGDRKSAERSMEELSHMLKEMGREATHELKEFGDHLYNFGRAELASSVYDEALECAVEWHQADDIREISNRIKQCHAALSSAGHTVDTDLAALVDNIHHLDGKVQKEYFAALNQLMEAEALAAKPLAVTTKEWTRGADLPAEYHGWHESVRVVFLKEKGEDASLVLVYLKEIGTLGFYMPGNVCTEGMDHFRIRIDDDGYFKILDAPENFRRRYGIRGLIGAKEPAHVEIKRILTAPELEEEALRD